MKFYTAESPLLVDGSRVEAGEHAELTDEMAERLLQLGRVKEVSPAVQKAAAQAKIDALESEGSGKKSPKPAAKRKAPQKPAPQQPAPKEPAPEATNPPENETGGETAD